jgi:hypothetical protein
MRRNLHVFAMLLLMLLQVVVAQAYDNVFKDANEWIFTGGKSLKSSLMASKAVPNVNTQLGPIENYGFISGPDGSMWTYTATFAMEHDTYTSVTLNVYDNQKNLIA